MPAPDAALQRALAELTGLPPSAPCPPRRGAPCGGGPSGSRRRSPASRHWPRFLVALIVATPSGDDAAPAPASLRPDVSARGAVTARADPPPDLMIRCVEGTQAVRDATEGLRGAPWLTRGAYDRTARPSLVLPAGNVLPRGAGRRSSSTPR